VGVVAVGQALKVTDDQGTTAFITVESVKYSPTNAVAALVSEYPPKNGLFAVVNVLVEVDAGAYPFNSVYFKWQTPDATTYSVIDGNAVFAGFEPAFGSGKLSTGQKTRGNVVFDVPTKGGLLQLTSPTLDVIGQWTMPST
jgi:Domain of unknown function (DUF4352)